MQNLDGDLKEAFLKTLCGTWKERKETVDRVFVEDAKFWLVLPVFPFGISHVDANSFVACAGQALQQDVCHQ